MFEDILRKIKPSEKEIEKIDSIAKEFGDLLKSKGIKFFFGGSYAKKTFLKNLTDIDVYLLINKEEDIEKIKEKLKSLNLNMKILYGSREYFHIYYKGILFELVPTLNIPKDKVENSIDISKYHVEFVRKEIEKNPRIRDEILLFKYFLKQKGLYGAESYNRGFSGYLSEVLVINFGSFINTIKFFSNSQLPINIGITEEIKEILKKEGKLNNYFNVVDPVFRKRNLGMAVSKEKVLELVFESKLFLKNLDFSKKDKFKVLMDFYEKLNKEKYVILKVKFTDFLSSKYNNPDIIGSKMLKETKQLIKKLQKEGFNVYYWAFKFSKDKKIGESWILTDKNSNIIISKGPNLFKGDILRFVEKHREGLVDLNNESLQALEFKNKNISDFIKENEKKELFELYL